MFGLDAEKHNEIVFKLRPVVEVAPDVVDGILNTPKGLHRDSMEWVTEIHGKLTPSQLRLLDDALDVYK